jgi:Divergent InlB B-repeat domain
MGARAARVVALAALAAAGLAGCYAPDLAPCTVRCTQGDACPAEMSCGPDHSCHPAGDTSTCPPDYLTVSVHSSGTGTGMVSGGGLDCGPLCDTAVPKGTTIKLVAAADSGSRFTGWAGACMGAATTCSLKVDADVMVGAGFNQAKPLSLAFDGNGGGHVTSDPGGIDCTADCTGLFDLNSTVTLTAIADAQSSFSGWSGECQGTGACVVSMAGSVQVTAEFE